MRCRNVQRWQNNASPAGLADREAAGRLVAEANDLCARAAVRRAEILDIVNSKI